jgi:hypothetical protein
MKKKSIVKMVIPLAAVLFWGVGCSAGYHAGEVNKGLEGERMTVGTVQRTIRLGMSSADVVEALGSPNIVTTDELRREVWVYDRVASDVYHSGGYWNILVAGQSAGASSNSQRTLAVVVKYDESMKVRDFAYHASRF